MDVFRREGCDDRVEGLILEGELLCKSACEFGFAVRVAFCEISHRSGFVDRNSNQASVKEDALQVSRTMTDLESPYPFDEGEYLHDPVFPMTKGNDPRHKVIRERKWMI